MTMPFRLVVAGVLMTFACGAWGQSGSIVQDEHDKRVKADSDRNTKYHNNADDYPKNTPTPAYTPPSKPAAPTMTSTDIHNMYALADKLAADRKAEFDRALRGAQAHNEQDMMKLADYLLRGYGTTADKKLALSVYDAVARMGPSQAFRVGSLLAEDGPAADNVEAYKDMKLSAEAGYDPAKKWLATHKEPVRRAGELPSMMAFTDEVFRARGVGTKATKPGEGDKALEELKKVFAEKYTNWKKSYRVKKDAFQAGKATLYGVGVPADPKRAVEFLRAAQGGETGTEEEAAEYLGWAEWAAAKQAGGRDYTGLGSAVPGGESSQSPYLAYLAAVYYCATGDPYKQRAALEKSRGSFYNKSTKKYYDGPTQAGTDLAVMELEGVGGPLDEHSGVDLLTRAATAGNSNAKYILGVLSERGIHGVAKDPAKAAQWFQAAASAGQADAQKKLVTMGMAK